MTKIELISELLKALDEKERLEAENAVLRKKVDEYESVHEATSADRDEENPSLKLKLRFANLVLNDEKENIHEAVTKKESIYHDGCLSNYSTYYPDYEKGMTFGEWMNRVEWDTIDSDNLGKLLKKKFGLDEVKELYREAYLEVFNHFKKEAEEEAEEEDKDGDNAH